MSAAVDAGFQRSGLQGKTQLSSKDLYEQVSNDISNCDPTVTDEFLLLVDPISKQVTINVEQFSKRDMRIVKVEYVETFFRVGLLTSDI